MANYDWREEHPLGKAEWIKVFGFLTGKEKQAMAYFSAVEKTYNDTKKKLQNIKDRPEVLVGSLIGESWFAPAGESYMAQLLRDAGADYLYKDLKGTGSCERTLEQVFKDQQTTKVWINAGAVSLPDLLKQQQKYGLFTSVKEGKVYCYTHNSNYFWEMGDANPHWVLSDLATICGQPNGNKLHFFKQLERLTAMKRLHVFLLFFLLALVILTLGFPHQEEHWLESFFLAEGKEKFQHILLTEFRIPRLVIALVAGASLSVCGLLLQTLLNNPLAGPSILGLTSGAHLFVALTILAAGYLSGTLLDLSITVAS